MAPNSVLLPVSEPPPAPPRAVDESAAPILRESSISRRGAFAALSYMSCAVLLVMFNKAALSSYNFPCANVITLSQMISSTCFLYTMRRWRIISFTNAEAHKSGLVPPQTVLLTLPLSLAYLLYMVHILESSTVNLPVFFLPLLFISHNILFCFLLKLATMECVRGVNVPMYTTLRRTTVVFTMTVEYLMTRQKYSFPIVGSVAMIVFGAFVAGARDLSFDVYGYAMVFIANMTTAIYLATINRTGKTSGLNSFGLMWCNGIVCGPILFFWIYIHGDLELTMNFPYLHSLGFQIVMVFSCIMAFFLNYCIFVNTTLNSALTQTMCGNLKDLFTIGLGWLLFGGLPFDTFNVIGQVLGFVGSGFYAYCKIKGK